MVQKLPTLRHRKGHVDHHLAKALSHPLRVKVLDRLQVGAKSPKTLAGELDLGLSLVSYHVGVLRDLGLIRLVEQIPRRGATEHIYAIEPLGAGAARAFDAPASPEDPLAAVLQKMVEQCVTALRSAAPSPESGSQLASVSAVLDGKGWEEAVAILAQTEERLESVRAASAKRLER